MSSIPSSKFLPAVGVELVTIGSAPGGEMVEVNVSTHDQGPALLEFLASALGLAQPVFVGDRKIVGILKDCTDGDVVLAREPGDADGSNFNGGSPL